MAAAAGEVKHFVFGHLTEKLPFASFIFQRELNRRNKLTRMRRVLCMCAACVLVELSPIDIWLNTDNNRPDTILLLGHSIGKAVWQFAVTLAFAGLCADAGDQIVWNCDVLQILCQIKCWRGFLRQNRRWEQTYNHNKAE